MSAFGYSLFGFIIAIAVLVTVHEYGHFWVARKLGVRVLKFSIGFGKPIFSWRRKDDPTEYCVAMIPLGGYVKMLDEREAEVAEEERAQAFNRQSLAVRSAIVVAGPAANFLFALFAIWLVFVIGDRDISPVVGTVAENSIGERAGFRAGDRLLRIDGREVQTWTEHQFYLLHQAMKGNVIEFEVEGGDGDRRNLRVDYGEVPQYQVGTLPVTLQIGLYLPSPPADVAQLLPGAPAERAGLQVGDRILAVDGEAVANWDDLVRRVSARPGQRLELRIERDGGQWATELTPEPARAIDGAAYGRIGLYRPSPFDAQLRYGPLTAIAASADYNWRMSIVTLYSLGRMLSARMSTENLSGPITIARLAGHTVESGFNDFLKFLAIISISLGLINLLPIPLLDGGHLLFFAIEAVKGSPPSDKAMLRFQKIGIVALILLMSVAFYNDIMRLF